MTTKQWLFITIGTVLIAYLLLYFYRSDSDVPYWSGGDWYIDPKSTINDLNNP